MGHLSGRAVAHASSSYFLLTAFLKWLPHLFAFLCETGGHRLQFKAKTLRDLGPWFPTCKQRKGGSPALVVN